MQEIIGVVSWSVKLMHLVNTCRCGFVNHENSTFWIESFTWIYVYLIKVSVINISEQYLSRSKIYFKIICRWQILKLLHNSDYENIFIENSRTLDLLYNYTKCIYKSVLFSESQKKWLDLKKTLFCIFSWTVALCTDFLFLKWQCYCQKDINVIR